MCRINPLSEIRAIAETSRRKCLPAGARLLWRVLFDCANDRQERDEATNTYEWPDGFFPVCNDELKANSAMEKRALLEARNKLKEIGAIDFIPGENNRRPAEYRLFYLTAGRDRNVPAGVPAGGTARKPASAPAYGTAGDPIYKDKDTGRNMGKTSLYEEEEEEEGNENGYMMVDERARTRVALTDPWYIRKEKFREGYVHAFGREPNPTELEKLESFLRFGNTTPEMVAMALKQAAAYGAESPIPYIRQILVDWWYYEVRHPHQVDEFLSEYSHFYGNAYPHLSNEEWQAAIERRRSENRELAGE